MQLDSKFKKNLKISEDFHNKNKGIEECNVRKNDERIYNFRKTFTTRTKGLRNATYDKSPLLQIDLLQLSQQEQRD